MPLRHNKRQEKIAALTLGLARRYSHSATEMLDLNDLSELIEWTEKGDS